MPRRLAVLLLLTPILFTSCVEFDGQTASYHYDRDKDELRLFQVYERIHVDRNRQALDPLTSREKEQLKDVQLNHPTFFFGNWIFVLRTDQMESGLEQIEKNIAEPDPDDETSVKTYKAQRELTIALLESMRVANGKFYTNEQGELCAYQEVTFAKFSKVVAATNKVISAMVMDSAFQKKWTAEDRVAMVAAAKKGSWWRVNGNQMSLKFPVSREDYSEGSEERDKLKANGKPTFISKMTYQQPFVHWTVGGVEEKRVDLRIDNLQEGRYNDLVLRHLREQGKRIHKDVDINKVRTQFLQ